MNNKNINLKPALIIFVIFLIGWISLCGETLQAEYKDFTFLGLLFFLFASFIYKLPKGFSLVDFMFFLFIFSVTLGLNYSTNKSTALHYYALIILPMFFLYFSLHGKSKDLIYPIAWGLFAFGFIISGIGILEIIFRKNIIYELWIDNYFYQRFIHLTPRIMSTQMHPTAFGSFLLGCIPFSYLLFSQARKPYRILIGLAIILFVMNIIFTFSRGNILGLASLSFIYFLSVKKSRYIPTLLIGLFALIIISSTVLVKQFNFVRFSAHALTSGWWRAEKEKSLITLKMLKDYPFSGAGLGHYRINFDKYSSNAYKQLEKELVKTGRNPEEWKIADNTYFSILAETGLLGL